MCTSHARAGRSTKNPIESAVAEHKISDTSQLRGCIATKSCALSLLSGDIAPLYRQLGQADGVHVMTVHVD